MTVFRLCVWPYYRSKTPKELKGLYNFVSSVVAILSYTMGVTTYIIQVLTLLDAQAKLASTFLTSVGRSVSKSVSQSVSLVIRQNHQGVSTWGSASCLIPYFFDKMCLRACSVKFSDKQSVILHFLIKNSVILIFFI